MFSPEEIVEAIARDQLMVTSALDEVPVVEHHDVISVAVCKREFPGLN